MSHKIFFQKRGSVTMRKCESAFAATIYFVTFRYSLCHYQSSLFVVHFSNAFWHRKKVFPKSSSQNEIFPVRVIFHLLYGKYRGAKIVQLSKLKFLTRVAFVQFGQHSCHTRVVHVALVSLVSLLCRTRVVFVSLVSLVSGTRIPNQTRSNILVTISYSLT